MATLELLLDTIITGVPTNAAYDLIKAGIKKATGKSWPELYLEAFKASFADMENQLSKYTQNNGEVTLAKDKLNDILQQDLGAGVNPTTFSQLDSPQIVNRLASIMKAQYILQIGGNNLSHDDYAQLLRNLVTQAHGLVKQAILKDENAFRQALILETAGNTKLSEETIELINSKFGLNFAKLDEIKGDTEAINTKVDIVLQLLNQYPPSSHPLVAPTPQSQAKVDANKALGEFDVFLCHNSQDKPAIREIAHKLIAYGIRPWLDEWELRPGLPFLKGIEKQIKSIKSAAVFFGPNNLGPFQDLEQQAFIRQMVKRDIPVIPVILPNVTSTPELPVMLEGNTWVDFRKDMPDPFKQMVFGIRGISKSPANL